MRMHLIANTEEEGKGWDGKVKMARFLLTGCFFLQFASIGVLYIKGVFVRLISGRERENCVRLLISQSL